MNLLLSNKLTVKQRKWLKVYKETLNATEAAMQAYDCQDRKTAANIGYENVAKLDIVDILDAVGLDDESIAKGISEGAHKSGRPVVVNGQIKSFPDHGVRHKYYETALKLKGKLQTSKVEVTGKDGEPLKMELLLGVGFLNKPKEVI